MSVEVIDIGSSSDEDDPTVENISQHSPSGSLRAPNNHEHKPTINATSTLKEEPVQTPQEILEARRKKVDQLLDLYLKYHERLHSVEYLMNPEQKQRWHGHLNAVQKPLSAGTSQESHNNDQINLEFNGNGVGRRPPWFIDPPSENSSSRARPRGTMVVRRKKKYKKKRTTVRKLTNGSNSYSRTRATARRPTTSSTANTSSSYSSSSARASSKTDRKPTRIKSETTMARVKKEH